MKSKSHYCAEVIESSLQHLSAECWPDHEVPSCGSLIVTDDQDVCRYAFVYASHMNADETLRSVRAYQKTQEELRAQQPHIFAFLKTTVSALIVGEDKGDRIQHMHASRPIALHTFVRLADQQEYHRFFMTSHYIALIFGQAHVVGAVEELLLHIIVAMKQQGVPSSAHEDLIDAYVMLSGADYRRMKLFLYRVQQL
jgi:hypothetical protein